MIKDQSVSTFSPNRKTLETLPKLRIRQEEQTFSLAVKTLLRISVSVSEFTVQFLSLEPDSKSLLTQILEGSSHWGPAAHAEDLASIPSSQLQAHQAAAGAGFGKAN